MNTTFHNLNAAGIADAIKTPARPAPPSSAARALRALADAIEAYETDPADRRTVGELLWEVDGYIKPVIEQAKKENCGLFDPTTFLFVFLRDAHK